MPDVAKAVLGALSGQVFALNRRVILYDKVIGILRVVIKGHSARLTSPLVFARGALTLINTPDVFCGSLLSTDKIF